MQLWDKETMNGPWSLDSRTKLAVSAIKFFNVMNYPDSCKAIDKKPKEKPELFSLSEFVTYLENEKVFGKKPNVFRVFEFLNSMSSAGILQNVGNKVGETALFGSCYLFFDSNAGTPRGQGTFWLAPVLGADFLYRLIAPGIVHITGKNENGDEVAGTGVIFHPQHILTCRHVVCDMQVDREQVFQGIECVIDREAIHKHEKVDVAVVRVNSELQPVPGLVFQAPVIAQTVFTLG